MENLPIDIHSNKLLDWLISRRHCPKQWQGAIEKIREKISHAIQDMPENEQIVAILSDGQYINYFHCRQILDILHDTEKDTKNMFGFYSSQRVKDWKEITLLYERDNVYLAEAANFLQRFVQYEVPALRKQITKAEGVIRDNERKKHDCGKQAAESRRAFERELTKWKLQGQYDLRTELLVVANSQPTGDVQELQKLTNALEYFINFSSYICKDTGDLFPLIRWLTAKTKERALSELTLFEWLYGRRPVTIEAPVKFENPIPIDISEKEDEIDFGDDEADIDFCTNGDGDRDSNGIEIVSLEDDGITQPIDLAGMSNIARGEEAFPILEHLSTRSQFLSELDQLISFLKFRLQDEQADFSSTGAGIYLSGLAAKCPPEIAAVNVEQLLDWFKEMQRTATELGDPQLLQLLRVKSSQRFVDEIISQLEQKRRLEFKYQHLEQLAGEKQQQSAQEIEQTEHLLEKIVEAAKKLQENLEGDISRRYNGREVYIMGEINAILYGS